MKHEEIRAADTDNLEAVVAEWQTRLVQVQVLSPEWGFNSPRRHQIFCKKLRVWHNGCAPAFQAGYRGSTPLTRSIKLWWDSRAAKGGRL